MKHLKLDHDLAGQVLAGTKTSTWRLYDDKDLSVNDDVELIDKVDPTNPETWKPIGFAHIDAVIQKRLGDVDEADYEGHSGYASRQAMLDEFRKHYGPQVDLSTAVKIIRFSFSSQMNDAAGTVVPKSTSTTEVKLYADGGSRGNPGPSASGYAIINMEGDVVVKKGEYLGVTTNNQAEYQALKSGLEEAERMGVRQIHVFMDSLLVINQMLGIFKVKNRDLWPIHASIKELVGHFEHVVFTHVPRELNKIADAAVNEALDTAVKH
jgi:ribonuclease HI